MNKKWPDFFIVGAPRSGTTSLYEYFKKIPQIFMLPKECGYFSKFSIGRIESVQAYRRLFENVNENQLVGDATAIYLRDPETPKLIYESNPNAKIIILLRDPIERAFSHYLMFVKNGYETEPFSTQLQNYFNKKLTSERFHNYVIMPSFYYDSVSRYVEIFGANNVKICLYEEFAKNTSEVVKDMLDFLDIETELPKNVGRVYNKYAKPLGKTRQSLVFNPIIKNLAQKLLNKSARVSLTNSISINKKPTLSNNDKKILHNLFFNDVKKLRYFLRKEIHWNHFSEIH